MLTNFASFFRPPTFDDPEKAARARSIHAILLSTCALTFVFLIYAIFFPPLSQLIVAIIALAVEFGLLALIRSKKIYLASWILTVTLWIAIVIEVALYGGIRDTGFGTFAAIILIAGLTIGVRGSSIFATLTILASAGLAFAENQGLLPPYAEVPITQVLLSHCIMVIAVTLLLNLAINNLARVAQQAIEKEKKERGINALLEKSQAELNQRTSALEQRNITLQTVASVSQIANQVKSEQEFLEQSAKLLIEQNKLEHVSIFILDQIEENAILQISLSHVGKSLAPAGTKLNVIRTASANLLMGVNTMHFRIGEWNYYIDPAKQLPGTNTNIIFPLVTGDRLYGLLNIQTETTGPENIDNQTLQMLADQIALSMANIRLLNQLQGRIQEIGQLVGGTIRSAWEQLGIGGTIGYTYDRLKILPIDVNIPSEIAVQLLTGKSASFISAETHPHARLVAPIILRENVIGVVGYDSNNINHEWQEDEKVLLETVASRVSLALENSRLVAEAQQRADRERLVSQVTTKMRETLDIETILKTAAQEMRQSLELSETEVRLQFAEVDRTTEVSYE